MRTLATLAALTLLLGACGDDDTSERDAAAEHLRDVSARDDLTDEDIDDALDGRCGSDASLNLELTHHQTADRRAASLALTAILCPDRLDDITEATPREKQDAMETRAQYMDG